MTEGEALRSIGFRAAHKDGTPGIQIGEIFLPSSDEEPNAIVGCHAAKYNVKDSHAFLCDDCGGQVWLAPGGQNMHQLHPRALVICLLCFLKRVEKEKEDKHG